jgi:hypothetical protein
MPQYLCLLHPPLRPARIHAAMPISHRLPLGDCDKENIFDNPQTQRAEAENRLGHSLRTLSGIPSAREINYCLSLALFTIAATLFFLPLHAFAQTQDQKFAMSKVPIPPDIEPDMLPPEDLSVWQFVSFGSSMQSAMNSEPLSSENNSAETFDDVEVGGVQTTEKTVGKRVRKPTTRYEGFWRHRDNVSWDSDKDFS